MAATERAKDLISFVDSGPTPYHAVQEVVRRLQGAGFSALDEKQPWAFRSNDRHYVVRNESSIIAFVVGTDSPASSGFRMVGAHTDSPNLKLKPKPSYTANGYRQVGVEVYGGVLLSTWLDRDLSVAGRLVVSRGSGIESVLVDLKDPLLRIPNLAIHLNREIKTEGLLLNPQLHMAPIWGLETDDTPEDALFERAAKLASVSAKDILDHDLSLYDVQGGSLAGMDEALIHTARLDNLASCHSGLTALVESGANPLSATALVVFNDHEEVGSRSAHGAAGPFLKSVLRRIVQGHDEADPQAYDRAIASSFLVSADMAHAVHPNYADRHEPHHMPVLGKGPVIKTNANQSYATDAESAGRFVNYCKKAGFEPQNFVVRTDLGCGSTIGPITSAQLGVKTVDVGNPMMSMHSCREMAATADVDRMHDALTIHFRS